MPTDIHRTILVAGPALIKRIDAEFALQLRDLGINTVFYTPKGVWDLKNNPFQDEHAPKNRALRVWKFYRVLQAVKPDHVELYINSPFIVLVLYALLTRLLGYRLVLWDRGAGLYYWNSKHNAYRRLLIRLSYRLAHYFVVKEAYMPGMIRQLNLGKPEQVLFLPNKIPILPKCSVERPFPNVLFLNSPKPWRHVELLADAIPAAARRVPGVRFWFVGSRNEQELEYVRSEMSRTGAMPWVEIRPYEEDIRHYYQAAALFVLPADLVYVNHSLLEAMERGVPPLVANVDPKVGEIVEHNVNGLVLSLNSEVWADAIVELLHDEVQRQSFGEEARKKVEKDFNLMDKVDDLIRFYETRVWQESHSP